MKYTEFTGKTVEEAVAKGLQELGLTAEQADVRVLEEGRKKLFGWIKARVEIAEKEVELQEETQECVEEEVVVPQEEETTGETDGERTVAFLEGLFELLNITACTELISEDDKVEINVTAANTNAIIGKHGGMLDAIQTLAGAVANTGRDEYKRVVVDCENYRENRETTLNKLAENLAQKAIRLGKKIKLEPMNPYERRIIHAALAEREGVKTESEGKEPNRYVVVVPENLEDEDAPAISARRDQGRRDDRRGSRGGFNRDNRSRNGNFNRDNRGKNDRGVRNGGYNKKPYNRDRKPASGNGGGTTLKAGNDFFGIFLGNSNNMEEK